MRECNNYNIKCVRNNLQLLGKAQGRLKNDYLQCCARARQHFSRADCVSFFSTQCSEMSHWFLETGHVESIYATEIDIYYKSGIFLGVGALNI